MLHGVGASVAAAARAAGAPPWPGAKKEKEAWARWTPAGDFPAGDAGWGDSAAVAHEEPLVGRPALWAGRAVMSHRVGCGHE